VTYSEPKELIRAKQLIYKAEFDVALKLLNDFEQKEGLNLQEKIACKLLRAQILNWQGKNEELIKLGEEIYKESQQINNNLQKIDNLIFISNSLSSHQLQKNNEALNKLEQAEHLLKNISQITPKDLIHRKAQIATIKAWISFRKGKLDQAKKYLEWTLNMREELGDSHEIFKTYALMANVLIAEGKLDHALKYMDNCMILVKEAKIQYWIGISHLILGIIYFMKGEFEIGVIHSKKSLEINKKINNKWWIGALLNNIGESYGLTGEYELALEYLEQSLIVLDEVNPMRVDFCLDSLIFVSLEMGNYELAEQYFHRLEQIANQKKDKHTLLIYNYNKALMLKISSRIRNLAKAEELFRQIIEEDKIGIAGFEIQTKALIHLCDLHLMELRLTNDINVLDEINHFIARLLDLSEKSHSFWVFCETFILKAKLALLTFDINAARRYLTQAQKIAENYGFVQQARIISNEHDGLFRHLDVWENLKKSKAPLTERIELSRLNEQMEVMTRKRVLKSPKLEAEQPVLLTIMSNEGNTLLSNPFTADVTIDSAYFSEFLTSCTTFCDQILSESFDRVKFGQHTVLITAIDSLSICYMFQGQSYSARQKLIHFSEAVKKEPDIMKILQHAGDKNIEIKVNEISALEELIFESFLSDPQQFQMPFKAYEGDGPFVFVSYSHTDRLQVYPIIDYLNRTGTNIWYDEGIPISEDWKKSIVDNLERCSAFLVFITPHIIDSEYVRKEISFALKKKKSFFSVYLKETELPSDLEFEIGNIQFMKKYLIPETEFYNKLNKMLDPVLK
jgi:tetratricopeptide (TPR) repeat protein